jgi:hypothetical protein
VRGSRGGAITPQRLRNAQRYGAPGASRTLQKSGFVPPRQWHGGCCVVGARRAVAMRQVRSAARRRWRFKVTFGASISFTTDVSKGGFCTEVMRVLPAATKVQGSLEGFGKTVPFAGRVAWNAPGDASLNMRGRMGISFTDVGRDLLDLFEARSRPG